LEVQQVDAAALAAHDRAPIVAVDVLDVQRQDLRGAGGRLVQQPPERLLANRHIFSAPQPLELDVRDRARAVGRLAAIDAQPDLVGQPVAALAERDERACCRDVAVPGRGRAGSPCAEHRGAESVSIQAAKRATVAELGREAIERLRVGASA